MNFTHTAISEYIHAWIFGCCALHKGPTQGAGAIKAFDAPRHCKAFMTAGECSVEVYASSHLRLDPYFELS